MLRYLFLGVVVAAVVGGLAATLSAWNPVNYGEVEAVTEFGALTGVILEEGGNWKKPFTQGTREFSILTHTYETSEHPDESKADYRDFPVTAQTSNGQQIEVTYTVKFRVDKTAVIPVLRRWGSIDEVVENVIKADSRSWARKLAQNYQAEELFSGDGILLYEIAVSDALVESFAKAGAVMEDFLIRKISFDPDYIQAIENQQIAQENIKTAGYNAQAAEFKRDEAIRIAEGDKQTQILLAEASARSVVLQAEAQGEAIRLQGQALKDYPEVIQWTFIQNLKNVTWAFLPSEGITPLLPIPAP